MRVFRVITVGVILCVTACGSGSGGGSSNPDSNNQPPTVVQTAEGRFIDTVVEGLSYSSGKQSGITDSSGTFTYEVGANGQSTDVTFSVGAVEIGTVAGGNIITPVDLTGSNSTMPEVQNIVRFLLMLDSDGDRSNGITLSSEVRDIATNWVQVDFTSSDLDFELAQIISDVTAVDGRTPILPSALAAQDHLEGTLACLSSGVFAGTFGGDDNGTFLLWIQHQRFDPLANTTLVGVTSALIFSEDDDEVFGVVPQQGLSFDSDKQFITGQVSSGAKFIGDMVDYSTIANGSWNNGFTSDSGMFIGDRIGGNEEAVYRLSGFFNLQGLGFTADESGLVALDIMADNSITGMMVTLRGNQTTLTGTLTGNTISVSGGGNSFTLAFDPDGTDSSNDLALGTTSGFIGTMSGASGTSDVIGTSCQPD